MTTRPRVHVALRPFARSAIAATLIAGCNASGITDLLPSNLPLPEQIAGPGNYARRVATIRFYGDSEHVDVPVTARAGVPVAVQVTSYGGGCVAEDTTAVVVSDGNATVVPYQKVYVPRQNEACTMELRIYRRTASVTFPAAGRATVTVIGRESPGDSFVTIQRDVTVQ